MAKSFFTAATFYAQPRHGQAAGGRRRDDEAFPGFAYQLTPFTDFQRLSSSPQARSSFRRVFPSASYSVRSTFAPARAGIPNPIDC